MRVSAAEQLFRNTPLLLNHERCAFLLPYIKGLFGLGRVDCDMDQPNY